MAPKSQANKEAARDWSVGSPRVDSCGVFANIRRFCFRKSADHRLLFAIYGHLEIYANLFKIFESTRMFSRSTWRTPPESVYSTCAEFFVFAKTHMQSGTRIVGFGVLHKAHGSPWTWFF